MSSAKLSGNALGTGSVTLAAPNTNSTRTLNLPDEDGTLYSSGTAVRSQKGVPAFSAYQSVAQSIPNNTLTKVQLQSEEFDVTGAFDNATNYRFQPTVAGYYQISGSVYFNSGAYQSLATIYKNGSEFKRGVDALSAAMASRIVSALVYLNGSTDYVELYTYQASGGALNTTTGLSLTYFQGILVAAA